uniref:Uncharacterized protein n=2 Tax=Oryza glumipatula TaxID=40148 RepID=A0A0E0BRF4_9ORYZ
MASPSQEAVESALAAAPPMPKWIPKGPPTAAADSADQATSTAAPAADQAPSSVDPAVDQAHAAAAGDQAPAQVAMQVDDNPGPVTRSSSVAALVHASPFKANKRKAVVTRTAKKLMDISQEATH